MKYLYAPWREAYFKEKKLGNDCVFCHCVQNKDEDEALGVFLRLKYCFGVMNKYPYATGHVMLIPYLHIQDIEDLPAKVWVELSLAIRGLIPILKSELGVNAVNIGMNLGVEAGAGIAPHCHYHLIPRRANDSNFITTVANTRVIVSEQGKICKRLLKACENFSV